MITISNGVLCTLNGMPIAWTADMLEINDSTPIHEDCPPDSIIFILIPDAETPITGLVPGQILYSEITHEATGLVVIQAIDHDNHDELVWVIWDTDDDESIDPQQRWQRLPAPNTWLQVGHRQFWICAFANLTEAQAAARAPTLTKRMRNRSLN